MELPTIGILEKIIMTITLNLVFYIIWWIKNSNSFYLRIPPERGDAPEQIKIRHIGYCLKADKAYGEGVAKALGIPLNEVK